MENKGYRFDFYKNRKIYFGISIALMVIGVVCNLIFGVKVDIQFSGGAMVQYAVSGGTVKESDVAETVEATLGRSAAVTLNQGLMEGQEDRLTIAFSGNQAITPEDQGSLTDALGAQYEGVDFTLEEINSVDPTMGQSFFLKCMVCLLLTVLLLLLYIGFRFRKIGGFSAGLTAVAALVHDVAIIYFAFVILRIPLNDNFIAAVLTILGYSLNDTIVIYDRIRENRRKEGKKLSYGENINISLNQTLKRSILTSVTTLLALAVVGVVGLLNGMVSVTTFAFPMMAGIISGCYSSICISTPLYAVWMTRREEKKAAAAVAKK